jgi:SAM-dependent methyltransferase
MLAKLGDIRGRQIVETGGLSVISRFFADQGWPVRGTSTDLRYEIDADDEAIDLVFSFEVIEHLQDQREERMMDSILFRETGVKRYAAEVWRILRPDGHLVLTTPNPCSLVVLQNLVERRPPVVYRQHIREYTRDELLALFDLQTVYVGTQDAFSNFGYSKERYRKVFEFADWDMSDRGDDHILILRKP